ncbi:uncharacterized protein A4U43_C04F29260 [Asparagus officinalis]|uniref:Uncharacterized protein n=1 Tax=Asparagus officinalis TaxID=4686 RepID=A0A5P1F789_ASPOF|nr:uncharacterized protein A4U43_C04F29260 [Asparagus officinalis]
MRRRSWADERGEVSGVRRGWGRRTVLRERRGLAIVGNERRAASDRWGSCGEATGAAKVWEEEVCGDGEASGQTGVVCVERSGTANHKGFCGATGRKRGETEESLERSGWILGRKRGETEG